MSQTPDNQQPPAETPTPPVDVPAPITGTPGPADSATSDGAPGTLDPAAAAIRDGYLFEGASIELGVLMADDEPLPDVGVRLPLGMLNRHGLIAGATGTGKTRTLQLVTEQLSLAGVPVFAADVKGDLSGLGVAGEASEKLLARTEGIGQDWAPQAFPVEYYALGGDGAGVPLRATISSFGPILLSKVLGLNQTQESSLGLIFHYADINGLPLVDLEDLRALIQYLISDEGKPELKGIGGISTATAGVILRELVTMESQGGEAFFGEPEFDTRDLLRTTTDGLGVISLLELPNLMNRPQLFSTFLMWVLADLFADLPEVGDPEKPSLVFFFDEAHLLFADASKAFLEAIVQTVRLIRSKGVGVVFVTQAPTDIPSDVLAQLGSRVQHQLRAHTPNAAKALAATVKTYPTTDYDLAEVLQSLGTGEAIVTVMDPDGAPTPVAWTRMRAPRASMKPNAMAAIEAAVAASPAMHTYGQEIDRDSAQEMLARKLEEGAKRAAEEEAAKQEEAESSGRRRSGRKEKSVVESVTSSTAFKQFVRTAAREIVRSIFGTARRR